RGRFEGQPLHNGNLRRKAPPEVRLQGASPCDAQGAGNGMASMKRNCLLVLALVWLMAGPKDPPYTAELDAQSDTTGEWRTYGADLSSTRYKPFDQINKTNFDKLEVAWRFKTDNLGPRPEFNFQSTPLMVGGWVYTTAGTRRAVVALDAATGEMKWMHSEDEGKRGEEAPRQLSGRGLAYWSDGRSARIIYVTPGYRMKALDAKTGAPITSFGKGGVV